tara:strand:- start:92 stop:964 length:873 start_codon:yes stop_codon:yes gene_type:complete
MKAYYNEFDRNAANWLRELINEGLIADGDVDDRSISDVTPKDLEGYSQCHFFAGIGGWSLALRQAGWPDSKPVWTGSCPCQPFSIAGTKKGKDDERHLWPTWFELINQRKPTTIFGEQVASNGGLGWLDSVSTDLEKEGYSFGAADLCAAGVGSPQLRQRLWFVAHNYGQGWQRGLPRGQDKGREDQHRHSGCSGTISLLDNAKRYRFSQRGNWDYKKDDWNQFNPANKDDRTFWSECDWLPFRDGKVRPVEPSTFPLANGLPARVGRLRGYGNAIVPQVAATFILASGV